jgi:hypothetical protein
MKRLGIFLLAILLLGACAKTGESEPGEANVQGNGAYCSTNPGLSLTASIPNAPAGKFVGYVNGVLAFDECTSPDSGGYYGANGFHFKRTAGGAVLYNSNFPYPQAGNQITLRFDYKLLCGTSVVQSGSKSVPLTDHGGCYSAQYAP